MLQDLAWHGPLFATGQELAANSFMIEERRFWDGLAGISSLEAQRAFHGTYKIIMSELHTPKKYFDNNPFRLRYTGARSSSTHVGMCDPSTALRQFMKYGKNL